MRIPAIFAVASFVSLMAACGGGSGSSVPDQGTPPPAAAQAIRFEVVYETSTSPPNAGGPGRFITVRSLPGSASLGTRPTSKVEITLDQEAPRSLAAPTYIDAQGRAAYVFPVSAALTTSGPVFARTCAPDLPLLVTVTDNAGASFTKYTSICVDHTTAVGAFSDYGDQTVTVAMSGPPAQVKASFRHNGNQGYVDDGSSSPGSGTATWTFRAVDGDTVFAQAQLTAGAAEGAAAAADIRTERGALAHSVIGKNTAVGVTVAQAQLVCCGATSPSTDPAQAQTVSFVVAPGQLGPIPGDLFPPPVAFRVHYRIVDGATQRTVTEFTGTGTATAHYTFPVKPGDQLAIEASPDVPGTLVEVLVAYGTADRLGSTLGSATSILAGSAAALNVICCAKLPQ